VALPACGADDLPAGLPVARLVAEPAKVIKLYACAEYSQAEQFLPANCDWYGASGLGRIEVQLALAEAVLLGIGLLAVWLGRLRTGEPGPADPAGGRGLRRSGPVAAGSLLAALAGLAAGVVGSGYEASPLPAIGLALFGAGAVGLGWSLRATGRSGYGWLTIALGGLGLLGAIDRGLTMIPFIPVPPSLLRILLELVWVGWTVLVVSRPVERETPGLNPSSPTGGL
jgi:hypothetical protein